MSIKTIVRREENDINGEKPNILSAGVVLASLLIFFYAIPRYVTQREEASRKYYG